MAMREATVVAQVARAIQGAMVATQAAVAMAGTMEVVEGKAVTAAEGAARVAPHRARCNRRWRP